MADLRRDNIMMDNDDFMNYYIPALDRHVPLSEYGRVAQMTAFDEVLGVRIGHDFSGRLTALDEPLPDDWKEFLIQLAGPYGKALLKAYRIKHGLEKVEGQNVNQD